MVNMATLLPIPDRHISYHPREKKFRCSVCDGGRPMQTYWPHVTSDSHQAAAARLIARAAADEIMSLGIRGVTGAEIPPGVDQHEERERTLSPSPPASPIVPPSPLTLLRSLIGNSNDGPNGDVDDSDDDENPMDFATLKQALEALAQDDTDDEDVAAEESQDESGVNDNDINDWYPFKRKEEVVALLIIGSGRSILSRSQYQRIRSILRICLVKLPEWGTVRDMSVRLKSQVGINVIERLSPSGTPLFGLDVKTILTSELANPFVSPHLVFVPELPGTEVINRLSQSKKWREDYPRHSRVQMVTLESRHLYIYEPFQLRTHQLVVPVFFYQEKGETMAKCLAANVQAIPGDCDQFCLILPEEPAFDSNLLYSINIKDHWRSFNDIVLESGAALSDLCRTMYQQRESQLEEVPLVNPWREKALGKVIRHMPITLYSDDTSGNVSKKFNKHMSVYFTLAGLAPEWTNQEYNIHFLATSNVGSAPDLLDEIVDNINDIGRKGFFAYDHSLGQKVLIMAVVLCHVGDSPMHAEISNTTNPAITLTPCRICDLKVTRQVDKKEGRYVRDFLCRNNLGHKIELPARDWKTTQRRTKEIWDLAQRKNSKTQVEDKARQYGQRDTVNDYFMKQMQTAHSELDAVEVQQLFKRLNDEQGQHLFNPMLRLEGFDGHRDTPVETLHVVLLGVAKYLFRDTMQELSLKHGSKKYKAIYARWKAFKIKGLNIPPIIPNTLIQFNRSLVGKEFRTVLQTVPFVLFDHISTEKRHLWTSLSLVSSFIFQHEITDLEKYLKELETHIDTFLNLLVRTSAQWINKPKFHMLIHLRKSIERFGPAILFASEKFESFNFSLRNASVHSNRQSPGKDIANNFNNRALLRMLLSGGSFFDKRQGARIYGGPLLTSLLDKIPELYGALGLKRKGCNNGEGLHRCGAVKAPNDPYPPCLTQFAEGSLQQLKDITLPNGQKIEPDDFVLLENSDTVGRVISIWKPTGLSPSKAILVTNQCVRGGVVPFYGMREYIVADEILAKKVVDVKCILNFQHNCHQGNCRLGRSNGRRVERQDVGATVPVVSHDSSRSFILNLASHYSAEIHRRLSQVELTPVSADEWNDAIETGIQIWQETPVRPPKPRTTKGRAPKRARQSQSAIHGDEESDDSR